MVCARWWFEATSAATVGVVTWEWADLVGFPVAASSEAVLAVATAAAGLRNEWLGNVLTAFYQRLLVPHRLRLGLVRAGVMTHDGRLPALVRSRCRRNWARISLRLPAGLTVDDVHDSRGVLAAACGALDAAVVQEGDRRDRAAVLLIRPRWGWPGR